MSNPLSSTAISEHRKLELLKHIPFILEFEIGKTAVIGNQSYVQEILNRIETITKKKDEYQYLVDAVTFLIEKSKNKEIKVVYKGRILSKEELFKEFGLFLSMKK